MYAVPESAWVRCDLRPLAGADITMADVAARLGVDFIEYDEDGLGRARGQLFRMKNGRQIMIQQLLQAPPPYDRQITIYGVFGPRDAMMADMNDALAALGVVRAQVSWTMDDVVYADQDPHAAPRDGKGPADPAL